MNGQSDGSLTRVRSGSATDTGLVRTINQDRMLESYPLFAVADGMGGHAAGEVASEIAIDSLRRSFRAARPTASALAEAAIVANREVWDTAGKRPAYQGMGTTLVAAAIVDGAGRDRLAVINVGDSRLYRLRAGRLDQITEDHNLVAELVADGKISPDEAEFHPKRHVLTRALGVDPTVSPDLSVLDMEAGDRYLLCSDGLPREVSETQIRSILSRVPDPERACQELVNEANLRGGNDNTSVVAIDIDAIEKRETSTGDSTGSPTGDPPTEMLPAAAGLPDSVTADPAPAGPRPAGPGQLDPAARAGAATIDKSLMVRPRRRLITIRVIAFFVVVLAILGLAVGGTVWYGRSGYFVSVKHGVLTIFKGRPGGVLWLRPTIAQTTSVRTDRVEPRHLGTLRAGVQEGSLSAARQFVANLESEYRSDHPAKPARHKPSAHRHTSRGSRHTSRGSRHSSRGRPDHHAKAPSRKSRKT